MQNNWAYILDLFCYRHGFAGQIYDSRGNELFPFINYCEGHQKSMEFYGDKVNQEFCLPIIEQFNSLTDPVVLRSKIILRPNIILYPFTVDHQKYFLFTGFYLCEGEKEWLLENTMETPWKFYLGTLKIFTLSEEQNMIHEIGRLVQLLTNQGSLSPKVAVSEQSNEPLTERENQVLVLIVRGLTNKEIAKNLFISENTVKAHVRKILQKKKVEDRRKLIILHSENDPSNT
ncbi:helix-turn-helix transcriptional regulator [Bacillus sp. EAC]|uniref:helix-turn-helix domain-containing protein n=1 Tax=Bacillus sp. EAC TaxID=1978338 RepID=UPI000B45412E|nr:response regulator transcription factor [Bacillus sp. EAC]